MKRLFFSLYCLGSLADTSWANENLSKQLLLGGLIEADCSYQSCPEPTKQLAQELQSFSPQEKTNQLYQVWLKSHPRGPMIKPWLDKIQIVNALTCPDIVSIQCQLHQNVVSYLDKGRLNDLASQLFSLRAPSTKDPLFAQILYYKTYLLLKNRQYSNALILIYDQLDLHPFHSLIYEDMQRIFNRTEISEGKVAIKGL